MWSNMSTPYLVPAPYTILAPRDSFVRPSGRAEPEFGKAVQEHDERTVVRPSLGAAQRHAVGGDEAEADAGIRGHEFSPDSCPARFGRAAGKRDGAAGAAGRAPPVSFDHVRSNSSTRAERPRPKGRSGSVETRIHAELI